MPLVLDELVKTQVKVYCTVFFLCCIIIKKAPGYSLLYNKAKASFKEIGKLTEHFLTFFFLFDKICTALCTYIYALSLCHL
jgi:hypothetical protein